MHFHNAYMHTLKLNNEIVHACQVGLPIANETWTNFSKEPKVRFGYRPIRYSYIYARYSFMFNLNLSSIGLQLEQFPFKCVAVYSC